MRGASPAPMPAASPDGQLVLTGSAERTARLWEVASALTN
jgi:WD40 repeat protein